MKICFNFIDNVIDFNDDKIKCLEIDNINYFCRVVGSINEYINGGYSDELINNDKLNFALIIDYFNLPIDSKNNINTINKYIEKQIDEEEYNILYNDYKKLLKNYSKILNKIDLPLLVNNNFNLSHIIKSVDIKIKSQENMIDKLFLLVDMFSLLNKNIILVFVNLKQYIVNEELVELYKYSLVKKIKLLLIENRIYDKINNFEKKIVIDSNLDEFII